MTIDTGAILILVRNPSRVIIDTGLEATLICLGVPSRVTIDTGREVIDTGRKMIDTGRESTLMFLGVRSRVMIDTGREASLKLAVTPIRVVIRDRATLE